MRHSREVGGGRTMLFTADGGFWGGGGRAAKKRAGVALGSAGVGAGRGGRGVVGGWVGARDMGAGGRGHGVALCGVSPGFTREPSSRRGRRFAAVLAQQRRTTSPLGHVESWTAVLKAREET